ncbi:MAG: response regulator [Lachnospiraceae bacterium]|nr:response regulator [Candidatus Colinaster scatohippi]
MDIYVILAIIALVELMIVIYMKPHLISPFHLGFYIAGVIACFGYCIVSHGHSLDIMLLGNGIYYVGGLTCCICMMVTVAEVCKVHLPKMVVAALASLELVILHFVFTVSKSTMYYKSVGIGSFLGMSYLIKQRGPYYILTPILIVGTNLISFFLIIMSMKNKKDVSFQTATKLLLMDVLSSLVFFLTRTLGLPIDVMGLAYVICMTLMLSVYARLDLYDMSYNLLTVNGQRDSEYGYVCFDKNCNFLGASAAIYSVVPEMKNQRIDRPLDRSRFVTSMPVEITDWAEDWIKGKEGTPESRQFSQNGSTWDASIREIRKNNYEGIMIEFHDDTRDMQRIAEIERAKETAVAARYDAEQANESKSAFLSVVSHEIRTPMNAVVGMTELLLRDSKSLTSKQIKYLKNIKNSGQALVMIVNDILDQSKIESGKMEIVKEAYEIRPMAADVKMIIENRIGSKPVHLMYEIDDEIPQYLIGDSLRIRQILINLLNNAVKFTEEGYIQLSIKCVDSDDDKKALKFTIKDSGQGIKTEDLKKLGQAFTQVDLKKNHNKEGTGLGLSISKNFIDLMGGKLEVDSEYGKGTEFFFTIWQEIASGIECTTGSGVSKQAWQDQEQFTAPGAKVLVVDDTEINLMIVEELLEPINMEVDLVDSGEKAIEEVQKKKYDIIFMDYMMPYMDGVETTEKIRALSRQYEDDGNAEMSEYLKSVPIVTLTGDNSDETKDRFLRAGIDDFTEKPVELRRLKKLLLKWLPAELTIAE